jgi:hypothetical protein
MECIRFSPACSGFFRFILRWQIYIDGNGLIMFISGLKDSVSQIREAQ